jgi:phosphoglycolate phosphatase
MTTFPTVVFDLDGTLVHSAPDIQAAINHALARNGRDPLDLATVISFVGNGVEVLVTCSLDATGGCDARLHAATLADLLDFYERHPTTLTRPYPGVIDCLARLKASGARLGICTNKPDAPARIVCDQLGLSPFFEVISGARPDVPKKPDPAPLLRCIADLSGTVEAGLYVGDSSVDYHTARAAGVAFRLFDGGYLNEPLPDLEPQARFSDWYEFTVSRPAARRASGT